MDKATEFEKGRAHFDAGEYFDAHEVWEDIWAESNGAEYDFLKGLIQTAVALHHAGNENWKGTRSLFATALGYLETGFAARGKVDVERLKNNILDFEIQLQKKLDGESVELPFFKLPFLE